MKGMLLHGLDSVVGAGGDVLSKIEVDKPAANPVVRWMEEEGYPLQVVAELNGNTLGFGTDEGPTSPGCRPKELGRTGCETASDE
jgi:hypothetical protein